MLAFLQPARITSCQEEASASVFDTILHDRFVVSTAA